MTNNDILRRVRYALNLSDKHACKLFKYAPYNQINIAPERWLSFLAKPEDPQYLTCSAAELCAFLDGLIVLKRGLPKQNTNPPIVELNRNIILRKLKIALHYDDSDMLKVCHLGGSKISKSELSALFRKPQHKHYRPCRSQLLRQFLTGLTRTLRPNTAEPQS